MTAPKSPVGGTQATPPLPFLTQAVRGGQGLAASHLKPDPPSTAFAPVSGVRSRLALPYERGGSERLQAHRARGKPCLLGLVSAYIAASPISAHGAILRSCWSSSILFLCSSFDRWSAESARATPAPGKRGAPKFHCDTLIFMPDARTRQRWVLPNSIATPQNSHTT